MRKKQTEFDLQNYKSQIGKPFGGSAKKGNPKTKRPFSKPHLMHVILKSSRARGRHSFLHYKNKKTVDRLVYSVAAKTGVQIKDYVNVGNHLHLLIKASHESFVTKYLRAISGIIARRICHCEKGQPLGFQFWDARPFSKIVALGRQPFRTVRRYFNQNRRQAQARVEGFAPFNTA